MALAQYADNGLFAPGKIADVLHTTSDDIARSAGLGKDAVQRKERIKSEKPNGDYANDRSHQQG